MRLNEQGGTTLALDTNSSVRACNTIVKDCGYYETPWGELIPVTLRNPEFITVVLECR